VAKWRILHLVGGTISPWAIKQLAGQLRLLPGQMFTQRIATGEIETARLVERETAQRVSYLRRRFRSELLASRTLRRVILNYAPQLVVCWDIAATEQLRLASPRRRRRPAAALMMFTPLSDRRAELKLQSNYHDLGLDLIPCSDALAGYLGSELGVRHRIHRLSPYCSAGPDVPSKDAAREQMGLSRDETVVFLSGVGRPDDRIRGIWACAIVQQLYPRLRVVMPIPGRPGRYVPRYYAFARHAVSNDFLIADDRWDMNLALSGADVYLDPADVACEPLAMWVAFGRSVPVAATENARITIGTAADDLVLNIDGNNPRRAAAAVLRLLEDKQLRADLTNRAKDRTDERGSDVQYRGNLVRLYQGILEECSGRTSIRTNDE